MSPHAGLPFPERIDERLVADGVALGLGRLGYAVTVDTDRLDALARMERAAEAFDVVVTDQVMPRLTGLGLIEQIRAIRPALPVILCAGYSEVASEESAVAAGASAGALPAAATLSLPILFAAGMAAMDTSDGVLMAKAYTWAFVNPARKIFYNITITGLSVAVALLVGTVEWLQSSPATRTSAGASFAGSPRSTSACSAT